MLMRAGHMRAGDHVDGAMVLWVGSGAYGIVVIALDAEVPDASGRVTRLRRYHFDEPVEVGSRATPGL